MEAFSLTAPVTAVLESILSEYPGGQMLQEGLQNADDAGASKFALMLDLRQHSLQGLRVANFSRAQGPAMLLFDNGGFKDADWKSLRHIHQSEKRKSPCTTGKYGMGSRSYFHYTDLLCVVSGSTYVAIDPLYLVSEGGFRQDLSGGAFAEGNPAECGPLIQPVFGCDMRTDLQGTLFRLPLRLPEHASECPYAPHAIPVSRARELMLDFVRQLQDGKIMLFLENVCEVEIWQWEEDKDAPDMLARQTRRLLTGSAPSRLPPKLLPYATTFEELHGHISGMSSEDVEQIGSPVLSTVLTTVEEPAAGGAVQTTSEKRWLVASQLSMDTQLVGQVVNCGAIPAIAVAFLLDNHQAADQLQGSAFCFLPLPILTGLPVHVHACFQVTKNRRSLWAQAADLDGIHQSYANWNARLMGSALPALYTHVIETVAAPDVVTGRLSLDLFFGMWPNTSMVTATAGFQAAVPQLYQMLGAARVFPAATGEEAQPIQMLALGEIMALAHGSGGMEAGQRDGLLQLCQSARYRDCFPGRVVDLPIHVLDALGSHLGVKAWSFLDVLTVLLEKAEAHTGDQPQLTGPLLCAALRLGTAQDVGVKASWARLVQRAGKWLPVVNGQLVTVADAYDPSTEDLKGFSLAASNMPMIPGSLPEVTPADEAAILRSLRCWGLRTLLSKAHILENAKGIHATVSARDDEVAEDIYRHGERLSDYIRKHGSQIVDAELCGLLQPLCFLPACPAGTPPGAPLPGWHLGSPARLLPPSARPEVWAVRSTALQDCPAFLSPRKMAANDIVAQVSKLSEVLDASSVDPLKDLEHLKTALKAFSSRLGAEQRQQGLQALVRSKVRWVPCGPGMAEAGMKVVMRRACEVAVRRPVGADLTPVFGTIHDACHSLLELFTEGGVHPELGGEMLAAKLEELAQGGDQEAGVLLNDDTLDLAERLAAELAKRLEDQPYRERRDLASAWRVKVPTKQGYILPAEEVYIDDAPGKQSSHLMTLSEKLSSAQGRHLQCPSIRDQLAKECEILEDGDDSFGQEEDLVDRIKQLLNEYEGKEDIFREFFQNTDDHGSSELHFVLDTRSFDSEQLVDTRARHLQGPALLVCSTKELTDEDIARMQRLGRSSKRRDAETVGRYGVGMCSMYHFSDCPQLLANNALHCFDPMRRFVARDGKGKPGRKYSVPKLEKDFPHMLVPFADYMGDDKYKAVFRLPLRLWPSYFGNRVEPDRVKESLKEFGASADLLLLFSRHVSQVGVSLFRDGADDYGYLHSVTAADETDEPAVKARVAELLAGNLAAPDASGGSSVTTRLKITTHEGDKKSGTSTIRTWVVSHSLSRDPSILEAARRLQEGVQAMALQPHGAAALCLEDPRGLQTGALCCSLPLEVPLGVKGLLLHGCFYLSSSRKHIPLAQQQAQGQTAPGEAGKVWNNLLLKIPMAEALCNLLVHCREFVHGVKMDAKGPAGVPAEYPGMDLVRFADLLSLPGCTGPAQQICSIVKAAAARILKERLSPIFPVVNDLNTRNRGSVAAWLPFGHPFRVSSALSICAQDQLVSDGMQLVWLPAPDGTSIPVVDYWKNLFPGIAAVTGAQVADFLRQMLPIASDTSLPLSQPVLPKSLREEDNINCLLGFITSSGSELSVLKGVPLLMLQSQQLAAFSPHRTCFTPENSSLLVSHPELFCTEEVRSALALSNTDSVFPTKEAAKLGVRALEPKDLVSFKDELLPLKPKEQAYNRSSGWLFHFWALAWRHYQRAQQDFLYQFSGWEVLPVISPSSSQPGSTTVIRLGDAGSVVNIADFDNSEQKDLGEALLDCGIELLSPTFAQDTNAASLVMSLVVATDDALVNLLVQVAQGGGLSQASAKSRHDLLAYWSGQKRTADPKKVLQLPLFLLRGNTQPGKKFVALAPRANLVAVCLHSEVPAYDGRIPQLADLDVPGVVQLAWPPQRIAGMYRKLGVKLYDPVDFMVDHVIPFLATLAAKNGGSVGPMRRCLEHLSFFTMDDHGSKLSRQRVIKAASKLVLVATCTGGLAKPSECLNPRTNVADAFEKGSDALRSWLPAPEWREEWLLSLLAALGMPSRLPAEAVLACAKHLDSVGMTELAERQSCWLMDEIVVHLPKVLSSNSVTNGNSKAELIGEACELRILVVLGWANGDQQQQILDEATRRSTTKAGTDMLPGAKVRQLAAPAGAAAVVLESAVWAVAPLVCSLAYCASHSLSKLMREKPADAACLGLLSRTEDLSCSELVSQIGAIVQVAGQVSEDFHFERGCQLEADVLKALGILNQRLAKDSATSAEIKAQLASLSNLPCIPVQLEADASRTSSNSVEFVQPCHCFFRLRATMKADSGHHFRLAGLDNLHTTLKALGVRDEPSIQDWANITASLAESFGDNPLPPNEKMVAIAAVNRIATLLEDGSVDGNGDGAEPSLEDIFVLSSNNRLVKARKCVWVDRMALRGHCGGLEELGFHFPAKAFVDSDKAPLEVLCNHGALKPVTGLVKEQLAVTCTDSKPRHQQDVFGLLFKSSEFRAGLRALMVPKMAQPDDGTGTDALDNLMDRLKLRWVEKLLAELVMLESGKPVVDSERGQPAFYQQEQETMVLCNTLLDSDKLATTWLADQICVMLVHAGMAEIAQKELVLDMLKCDAPSGIAKVLKEANVADIFTEEHHIAEPGMPLEPEYHDFLRTALQYTSFHVGEVVAVSSRGEDNEEVLLYAKVMELEHGEAAESYLERQYRLQIGPAGSTDLFKFVHIYKISRSAIPAPPPQVSEPSSAVVEGGNGSQFAGSAAATAAAKWSLIQQLKAMEKLSSLQDYKSAFRRLCLQYHPDKSQQSSGELFHLVKNHQVCFVRWIEEGIPFTDADWISGSPAQGAEPDAQPKKSEASQRQPRASHSQAQNHSNSFDQWMHELNAEKQRRQEAQGVSRNPARVPAVAPQQPVPAREQRHLDPMMADTWFAQARRDHDAARLLSQGNFYSHSVWMCQQAGEKLIKATMLRTCGLTTDEMKGKGAHNLVALVSLFHKSTLPAPILSELETLSWSYIAARYPAMNQPGIIPAMIYGEEDAKRAQDTVDQLVESTGFLPTPDATAGRTVTVELSSEDNARDIEFAPPPPQEAVREAVRIQPAQPGRSSNVEASQRPLVSDEAPPPPLDFTPSHTMPPGPVPRIAE